MGHSTDPPNRRRRATDGVVPPLPDCDRPTRGRRGFEPLPDPACDLPPNEPSSSGGTPPPADRKDEGRKRT